MPSPTLPWESIRNAVETAPAVVVVEMRKTGAVVVPVIESVAEGDVVARPKWPPASTMSTVVVASGMVEVAITKSGVPEGKTAEPSTESRAHGDEVPIPKNPFAFEMARKLAESRMFAPE